VSFTQFLIFTAVSAGLTVPAVLLIPRARQSPMFDRVLWGATWLLGFLSAWAAPNFFQADTLNNIVIGDVNLIPAVISATVGVLSINGVLWALDRLSPPEFNDLDESADLSEAENVSEPVEPSNEQS
jgi:hypothetical protein